MQEGWLVGFAQWIWLEGWCDPFFWKEVMRWRTEIGTETEAGQNGWMIALVVVQVGTSKALNCRNSDC